MEAVERKKGIWSRRAKREYGGLPGRVRILGTPLSTFLRIATRETDNVICLLPGAPQR